MAMHSKKSKGMARGGMKSKGYSRGGAKMAAKKPAMTLPQIKAAAKAKGYKLVKV